MKILFFWSRYRGYGKKINQKKENPNISKKLKKIKKNPQKKSL
jgi:hypothetical protein